MAWQRIGDKPLSCLAPNGGQAITWSNVDQDPGPPLPTKAYTTFVPIFAKKGVFFQWEARIREIKKKGVILQAWVREILKKGKILHVFIIICSFRMFEELCINVFEL